MAGLAHLGKLLKDLSFPIPNTPTPVDDDSHYQLRGRNLRHDEAIRAYHNEHKRPFQHAPFRTKD
jgi:hypothetical protein